ncbi:DUF2283 domain-containing protein [Candidatus Parcubacteria bacterium]|nr:DUF2283 domain-containing protein [Candidatus Parcubacteria bacterium]
MEITYDSKADALSITLKKGKVAKTIELAPEVLLDMDKNGRPLYLEIIGASEKIGKRRVSEVLMRNFIPAKS